ncbi:MAG: acylase [Arenicella sp.]|nr:acylase [Arenicella sp.]
MSYFKRGLGGIVFLAVVVAAQWLWNPLSPNPSAEVLRQGAETYDAEIVRDEWGVPHILGKRNADTSFGLAYAHAEDDFETIQEMVAASRGVLAQYRGQSAAPTDYLVQLLDVWQTVNSRYQSDVPEDVKEIARAYAAGINLYASQNPESVWQGLAPFTAEDIVAGFVFKTPFFYGLDKPLLDLFDENSDLEIALAPSGEKRAWGLTKRGNSERGSNAYAVSAERSGEDITRLLINSHQPLTGPVAWYEAHIIAEQGWNIQGGLFPGTPVILHGFSENLGWANTVNHIDLSDAYLLTRNPDNPNQYRLDGQWHDFEKREVTLLVKLWGDFRFPAKRTVLRSKHGPVIESGDKTYALRYAGMDEIRQLEQYVRLNQAEDFDGFMQAMQMNALPSINYVYADKENNIGFIHNAQYPQRDDSWDWSKGLPGDRSDLIWQGYRPFSEVPKLINPASGLIFNANNTPFSATDGPDNLRASDFPQSMGLATKQTNRSWRVLEMNDGIKPIGQAELLRQKFDIQYSEQSEQAQALQVALAQDWSDNPDLVAAQEIIKKWDRRANVENLNAALPIQIFSEIRQSVDRTDQSPAAIRQAVEKAVRYLKTNYGGLNPAWSEVNRLVRGDYNQPLAGGPDLLRAVYAIGFAEDQKSYATHGDSWMALVSWDQATGEQSAKVLHQFGSATLDRKSPHYADQADLFVKQQWRQASFDLNQIRASASRIYSIGGKGDSKTRQMSE